MVDKYVGWDQVDSPAKEMWLITPHDTNEVTPVPKALRFNAAGAVKLLAMGSTTPVTITVAAGEVIPVRAKIVYDTDTDAIVIHGLG